MNDVPQSGPERAKHISRVTEGVEWSASGEAINLEVKNNKDEWEYCKNPIWDWFLQDYRLTEPEVVMWANGYCVEIGIVNWYLSKEEAWEKKLPTGQSDFTHYIKRTTGGGRTIPQYEAVPLEDK